MPHHAVRLTRQVSHPRPPVRCDSYGPLPRPTAGHRRPHRANLPPPDTVAFVDHLPPTPIFASCMGDYIVGSRLRTRDGRIIGTVSAWAPYPAILGAPWGVAYVRRGSTRSTPYLVDLSGALFDGTEVTVPHDARTILSAPRLKASGQELTTSQRHQVHAHYRSRLQAA